MNRKKSSLLKVIFICLFTITLFLNIPAMAKDGKEYEEFLKKPHIYSNIINYLRQERSAKESFNLRIEDLVVLIIVDLFLSLFCLWLAIRLLSGMRTLSVKRYLWFLFIFNLTWFISLLVFNVAWQVLDFLVVKLRPDLGLLIIDNLYLIAIVVAMLIYIWLLARTFGLSFFAALGVFFTSHLLYFLIIFLLFPMVTFKENRFFNLVKKNLGVKSVIQGYLSDINKIVSGQNILSYIRIRPFHL